MKNMIRRSLVLFTVMFMICMPISVVAAEDIETWEESGTITLNKVTYDTRTRNMTVEITESSGDMANEYELYMMVEGEADKSISQYKLSGKTLSVIGIMALNTADKSKAVEKGNGVIEISDQEIYFGSSDDVKAGTTVLIGVESLDRSYTPSKSNLIQMEIKEGLNIKEANASKNETNSQESGNIGSGLLIGIGLGMILVGTGIMVLAKKMDNKGNKAETAVTEETVASEVNEEPNETPEEVNEENTSDEMTDQNEDNQ
ncbi:MAG: hypothetical protein J6S49_02265 [Erysipelotrichaceae bacterium]|nr:hypothetical protein [Erysipelotrichaceae bacterium]